MVDVDAVNAETRLIGVRYSIMGSENQNKTYHPCPLTILQILFCRSADALRLVEAEKAVVILPHNTFGRQEVVEEPLLSERLNVRTEDRERIWSESIWLIHSDEQILQL